MSKSIKLKNDIFLNGEICSSEFNSNGWAIKYANGIMICIKEVKFSSIDFPNTWGNWHETDNLDLGNYASKFRDTPYVFATSYGGSFIIEGLKYSSNTSFGSTYLMKPTSTTIGGIAIELLAIGRWK